MSSWNPPEEQDRRSSHDPGVKGREVIERREFSESIYALDWTDYAVFGVLAGIPASFLTVILLWEFFPGFQDTAGLVVRTVMELLPSVAAAVPW